MNSRRHGITTLVLDFDGTCTQIPPIYETFWEEYRKNLKIGAEDVSVAEWERARAAVRSHSPTAGWTLGGAQAAPAAADPYILASEAAQRIYRVRKLADPQLESPDLYPAHKAAYERAPAPWRDSAKEIFEHLLGRGVRLCFISNSSTGTIKRRLKDLFGSESAADRILVRGDAAKFLVQEPIWETPPSEMLELFQSLPGEVKSTGADLKRPIYLRRGSYFRAICDVIQDDRAQLSQTLFCGDIWELDLALPAAFGASIHLLERAEPFATYPYEYSALADLGRRGQRSRDLDGLLRWFE